MDDSKILIIGSAGQVGIALKANYPNAKQAGSSELDITDPKAVESFDWNGIEVIINAAAYTNVDGAETDEGRILAWKVNAEAVGNLAKVVLDKNLTLVHLSSDYVFDGTKNPHLETETFSPLGVYAQSKAAGDLIVGLLPKHYLVRTSWVIGDGKNFVRTMLSLGKKGIEPTVVSDQFGRLSFTDELVRAIDYLLSNNAAYGTYNLSNEGDPVSWADITREIFRLAGYNLQVTDTTTKEYFSSKEGVAPRPLNSTLSLDKIHAAGFSSHDWHDDLKAYIDKENSQ
jgi:dTDP-4-dehydrorhamnose reductase